MKQFVNMLYDKKQPCNILITHCEYPHLMILHLQKNNDSHDSNILNFTL